MTGAQTKPDAVHRVAIAGATGRMGLMLLKAVIEADDCRLSGAFAGASAHGQDAGTALGIESGIAIVADPYAGLKGAQVLIDFSRPEATMANLAACRELGVGLVIGTTGFSAEQKADIADAAHHIPIVTAPNMGIGINITFKLLSIAAKLLSTGYDIEIIEAHHRHKVDAPSGTALRMGEIIAEALGRDLDTCAVYAREGVTGERDPSTIGFSSIRGGDIIGDHTVMFAGTGERIEITHRSASRSAYVQGSLQAVRFLADRQTGLFDMFDVLGLR
ncbi:4-hydroxy-tetrahydrodipicolinate reductase [Paraburkholderia megapolitana]|uniref:4-hydroxy-tetrahydrodipicolinate reductase n=2 Tax=Paraburkholderia megapolitana TaxID=420953 RepID=A0A1I3MPT3_9BURK|nr:4-hydroxy-tetrahydrodipicolinate reductase [Paraburkholderia megapolitana]QDQ84094.1 4-hydroxy-tetrahydrodipicolinate reductase [Paraburkholderia megapolitana]SFI99124.1 dihydrodipicolinate reductase [Paraburkholderia megapolitana]